MRPSATCSDFTEPRCWITWQFAHRRRVERLEDFVTVLLASSVVSRPHLTESALGCADEYGLRARVEAEMGKGGS